MHLSRLIKQKSYEEVEHVYRRHPITLLPPILISGILLAVPIVLYILTNSLFPNLLVHPTIFPILVLATSAYLLSIYLFIATYFIDFYLDMWVLTNDRIVDIEQFNLFSRTISEMDLFRIQDIRTDVHGFFPTFFDYGDVTVKTASQNVHIVFHNVPHPNEIRTRILALAEIDRIYHGHSQPYPNKDL